MSAVRRSLPAVLAGIALASCGPTPPQAPFRQAKKLDDSTGGISTACGLANQLLAFDRGDVKDLHTLEASAASKAQKLAGVYAHNPNWIYQGQTVRQIVKASVTSLDDCGLPGAAAVLAHATGVKG